MIIKLEKRLVNTLKLILTRFYFIIKRPSPFQRYKENVPWAESLNYDETTKTQPIVK